MLQIAAGSAANQFLQMLRIARALQRDLIRRVVDFTKVACREFQRHSSQVFKQRRHLRRSRNRPDPRLLPQQPSERDLRRGRLHSRCNGVQQIDHGLIGLPGLRRKPWHYIPEIRGVELRVFVNLAREESLAKRAEGYEADSLFRGADVLPHPSAN